jgi:hypothetical protein
MHGAVTGGRGRFVSEFDADEMRALLQRRVWRRG